MNFSCFLEYPTITALCLVPVLAILPYFPSSAYCPIRFVEMIDNACWPVLGHIPIFPLVEQSLLLSRIEFFMSRRKARRLYTYTGWKTDRPDGNSIDILAVVPVRASPRHNLPHKCSLDTTPRCQLRPCPSAVPYLILKLTPLDRPNHCKRHLSAPSTRTATSTGCPLRSLEPRRSN